MLNVFKMYLTIVFQQAGAMLVLHVVYSQPLVLTRIFIFQYFPGPNFILQDFPRPRT